MVTKRNLFIYFLNHLKLKVVTVWKSPLETLVRSSVACRQVSSHQDTGLVNPPLSASTRMTVVQDQDSLRIGDSSTINL